MTRKKLFDRNKCLSFRLVQKSVKEGAAEDSETAHIREYAPLNEASARHLVRVGVSILGPSPLSLSNWMYRWVIEKIS